MAYSFSPEYLDSIGVEVPTRQETVYDDAYREIARGNPADVLYVLQRLEDETEFARLIAAVVESRPGRYRDLTHAAEELRKFLASELVRKD